MKLPEREYLLNPRSGILHTYPASEACNTDQLKSKVISKDWQALIADKHYRKACVHCFDF